MKTWMRRRGVMGFPMLIVLVACSTSPPPGELAPGALSSGTAQVTIEDHRLGTTHDVSCQTVQSLTNIRIQSGDSSVTAYVDNATGLTAYSVAFSNVAGFTGSYQRDIQGAAEVVMTSQTYHITGKADGFDAANSAARTTASFAVKAAC